MLNERHCLWKLAVVLASVALSTDLLAVDAQISRQRKSAAHRHRRIIMDNDGNEPVYYIDEATPEALLAARTTGLVGTQVDTIVYCTWSSGFGQFTHNTKVGQVFDCTAEKFSTNKTGEFIRQGTDPLEIVVHFCREHSIEIFWSMRMNDTHDASSQWYAPYLFPQLKRDHPEWLVASKENRSKVGGWSAVDYARPEIRDLAFRYVEEVCNNYQIDGVMLDFFRHPVFFKPHAMGGAAGQAECDLMTGMLRRIRQMADGVAARRGRPILIAVRTPDSADYARAIGLDIVRWMKDDLIDLLVVSDYFRLNPWEASVRLGHEYGVPVYPCLSESRIKGEAGGLRNSPAGYRARAMNALAAGADGVYTFNLFDPKSPVWNEIGDPKTITARERLYSTGARGVNVINHWMADGKRFLNRDPLSPENPRKLEPGKPATIDLTVGEDLAEADVADVTLRLQVQGLTARAGIAVSLNDQPLKSGKLSEDWLDYRVEPGLVSQGANRITVTAPQEPKEQAPTLQDLCLRVRPRPD